MNRIEPSYLPHPNSESLADDGLDIEKVATRCESELLKRGAASVNHARWSLYEHLLGTFQTLLEWRQPSETALAGLMHSIYSTEVFGTALFSHDERELVIELLGDDAEKLAYVFCSARRAEFFAEVATLDASANCELMLAAGSSIILKPPEIGALLLIHIANLAEQAGRNDGSPVMWLSKASQYANWARSRVSFMPNLFSNGTDVVAPSDEERLLVAYLAATSGPSEDPIVFNSLARAVRQVPFVGEPFVWLGLMALASGAEAHVINSHATNALKNLRAWNVAWDKRLAPSAWLGIAEWLRRVAESPESHISFVRDRVRRLPRMPGMVQSAYADLDSRAAFGFAITDQTQDAESSFVDQVETIPSRFAEYLMSLSDPIGQGRVNFYPDLEHKPWHLPSNFPIVKALEMHAADITRELESIEPSLFHRESERIRRRGSWDVFMLYERGKKQEANCALCPITTEIVENHRTVRTSAGLTYFSRMAPRTVIAAHEGPTNMRLRCHLGIRIPQECAITVGGVTRVWEQGKCIVFDDSFTHGAYNNGNEERVVLIVDLWHPDLSDLEIELLSGLQRYISRTATGLDRYWARNEKARLAEHH